MRILLALGLILAASVAHADQVSQRITFGPSVSLTGQFLDLNAPICTPAAGSYSVAYRNSIATGCTTRASDDFATLLFSGSSPATYTMPQSNVSTFTGSIAGTTLTTPSNAVVIGSVITGTGVLDNTYVTAGSGTSWTVNSSQTVGSETLTQAVYPPGHGTCYKNNGTALLTLAATTSTIYGAAGVSGSVPIYPGGEACLQADPSDNYMVSGFLPGVVPPISLTDGATISVPCPTQNTSATYYLTLTGNNHQVLFPTCPVASNGQSVKFRINAGTAPYTGLTFASGYNWTGSAPYAICTAAATPNQVCPQAEIANQVDWFGCDVFGTSSASTEWDCWPPQYNIGTTPFPFINAASCASASGPTCNTATTNMIGANLFVYAVTYYNGSGSLTAPTDSSGNTYTLGVTKTQGNLVTACYYKYAPTVTSAMTFSATFTNSLVYPGISVMGFSGAVSSPLDQTNSGNTSAVTSIQPGSITPTQANELVVACLGVGAPGSGPTSNVGIDSGYTIGGIVNSLTGSNEGGALAYLIQGPAAATNPIFSWTSIADAVAGIMSFK